MAHERSQFSKFRGVMHKVLQESAKGIALMFAVLLSMIAFAGCSTADIRNLFIPSAESGTDALGRIMLK